MKVLIDEVKIAIEGKDVVIKSYIPMTEKIAAGFVSINGAVSEDQSTFNDFMFESIFASQLVAKYSNFFEVFPEIKDMKVTESFDILETNRIIEQIVSAVEEMKPGEMDFFGNTIETMRQDFKKQFNGPARALIDTVEGLINLNQGNSIFEESNEEQ